VLDGVPAKMISLSDQKLGVWLVSRNARTFLTRPGDLLGGGACFPAPRSVTLGEHQLGAGVLGVLPYWLTRDPIATYNLAIVLMLML
jgi:hypothetical protein